MKNFHISTCSLSKRSALKLNHRWSCKNPVLDILRTNKGLAQKPFKTLFLSFLIFYQVFGHNFWQYTSYFSKRISDWSSVISGGSFDFYMWTHKTFNLNSPMSFNFFCCSIVIFMFSGILLQPVLGCFKQFFMKNDEIVSPLVTY